MFKSISIPLVSFDEVITNELSLEISREVIEDLCALIKECSWGLNLSFEKYETCFADASANIFF